MMLRYTVLGCLALNGWILVPSLAFSQQWWFAIVVLAGLLLWGMGFWRGVPWSAAIGIVVGGAAAALGIDHGRGLGWMLASLLLTLVAWDMSFFVAHLDEAHTLDRPALYRTHFIRLGAILVGGLVLSGLTFAFQLNLRPIWVILLGLFVIFGLSRTVRFLQQESD